MVYIIMISKKYEPKSTLPVYEVHEVTMEEALLLLTSQRHAQEESLVSRAGNRLRMPDTGGRLQ